MNVLQLLTTTNVEEVVKAHNEAYPKYEITVEEYRDKFLPIILGKILVKTNYVIEICHYEEKHDDPSDDDESITVSLIDDGTTYSMSFVPWGEILGAEILCAIHFPFSLAQQAAHLYWEMTFYGYEEESKALEDTLLDAVEEITRSIDKGELIGNVVNRFEPKPDETPEEKLERERRQERLRIRSANLRTVKIYKNGVLQSNDQDNS